MLALWESGAMLRAESSKRPFGSHVLGYIERVDVTRILGIVKQSPLWTMRSQGLAVDMPSDELELQRAEGRIGWAETPGVTGTKELTELRDTLFDVRLHESIRIARPVQEDWKCPAVRWSR